MTDPTARVADRRAPAYLGAARDVALPPLPLGWRLAVLVGVYFVAGLQVAKDSQVTVAREEMARYESLKHVLADETVDVVVDRRVGERRQRDTATDLQMPGWAAVRR